MRPIRRTFKELHIGDIFTDNGNEYIKKTSRTAYLIKYNKVFYFKANESVFSTGKYSSLYDGRYTVRLECNGNALPVYVTRFCNEYLGDSSTKQDGEHLADMHLNHRIGTFNMQTILEQFEQMLQRGTMPLFEYELNNGEYLLVHVDCTETKIKFNFDDSFGSVYFDSYMQGDNGYYSYEFDNDYDTLDSLLELIDANIIEGYILPNGLYMEDVE